MNEASHPKAWRTSKVIGTTVNGSPFQHTFQIPLSRPVLCQHSRGCRSTRCCLGCCHLSGSTGFGWFWNKTLFHSQQNMGILLIFDPPHPSREFRYNMVHLNLPQTSPHESSLIHLQKPSTSRPKSEPLKQLRFDAVHDFAQSGGLRGCAHRQALPPRSAPGTTHLEKAAVSEWRRHRDAPRVLEV